MPKYTFECPTCNLRFDRTLKMSNYVNHPCPSCSEEAPRVIEGFAFAFAHGGSATANSGVHDHDYPTADKLIGRDADQRWGVIRERNQVKEEARKQGGTHALIRRDDEGGTEYRPMTDVGRDARRRLTKYAIEKVRASRLSGR